MIFYELGLEQKTENWRKDGEFKTGKGKRPL